MSQPRPLDPVALRRTLRRLNAAGEPPWLHGEVARRMAERLPVIRLQPERIVDWHAFLGAGAALLSQAYPQAQLLAVEAEPTRRDATALALRQPWWSSKRWRGQAPAAALEADIAPGQAQLVWANMALPAAADPPAVLKQWQRALAVDGFLMFSTLGPGSLLGLRDVYAQHGWRAPFAPFVDMHDIGDMLVESGFADPVMDQEQLTLTWPSAGALLAELRALGANLHPQRPAGLRTPRWHRRLLDALAARAGADGRIALQFEVVYGHAFKPPPRPRLAAETSLPLEDMRSMMRARRKAG